MKKLLCIMFISVIVMLDAMDQKVAVDSHLASTKDNYMTPLHWAAVGGHKQEVENLLMSGADVNNAENEGLLTPLHLAAGEGHSDVVEILLALGSNVDARDNWGGRPVDDAAKKGYKKVVSLCIANGADVERLIEYLDAIKTHQHVDDPKIVADAIESAGITPLDLAVLQGNLEKVKTLVGHGADVQSIDKFGCTALHKASRLGSRAIAEVLITNGAHVMAVDNMGSTPLHLAACHRQRGVVFVYNEHGADLAAWQRQREVVCVLLEHGADMNAIGIWGASPIKMAINQRNTAALEVFLTHGAAHGVKINDWLPLGTDIYKWLKYLCAQGFYFNMRDHYGNSCLHWAAASGNIKLASILLKKGLNMYDRNNGDMTPLHFAAYHGRRDMANYLIDYQVELIEPVYLYNGEPVGVARKDVVNVVDKEGKTPLHYAAMGGSGEVVSLLLSSGVDRDREDKQGFKAYDYAKEHDMKEVLSDSYCTLC